LLQSIQLIRKLRPVAIIGFGSYYTVPLLLAAVLCGVPIILHEANTIPGIVNRLFSKRAVFTGIHFPDTERYLKGVCHVVGIPLRPGYDRPLQTLSQARTYFDLDPDKVTLLVFGGSQGAAALNRLVPTALSLVHSCKDKLQVLHFIGKGQDIQQTVQKYKDIGVLATIKEFEHQMEVAWSAADLVIGRAGASTIAEQIATSVPGILIPFPFATKNHQMRNAEFLAWHVQGGVFISETEATPERIAAELERLLWHDQEVLSEMRQNLTLYKKEFQKDMAHLVLHSISEAS
jgi:UDP-N-acetylglucosamine--N-acetylmuramyl-(pentapeptide) pyrophosphoryl-undecaprenol N-acetylglucosamine transferase